MKVPLARRGLGYTKISMDGVGGGGGKNVSASTLALAPLSMARHVPWVVLLCVLRSGI